SITGLPALKAPFEPLVPGAHKVPNTNIYRAPLSHAQEGCREGFEGARATDRVRRRPRRISPYPLDSPTTPQAIFR
ncbi:hypothetical protein ABZ259_26720, partial [Streptomyces cyaneofuscatus]